MNIRPIRTDEDHAAEIGVDGDRRAGLDERPL